MELRRALGKLDILDRLNDVVDVLMGNRGGRIRLWGGSGTQKNIRGGAVLASNVHALIVRDDGGFHVLIRNSTDTANVAEFLDAGVTVSDLTATGNLKWKSGTAFTITLDHTATADRTVTFQDLAGTVALLGVANAGNLIFVDATYDIGASGATRPRDLFLSRNIVIPGTLTAASGGTGTSSQVLHGGATPTWSAIVNADIDAAAAIAQTKLGAMDRALAYKNGAAQTISNATETSISFDAEAYDNATLHDNATNNSRLTAASAGFYLIWGNTNWDASATGIRDIYIRLNGSSRIATARVDDPTATGMYGPIFLPYPLSANDYVEMRVWQNSGGNLNVNTGQANTYFGMARLSA